VFEKKECKSIDDFPWPEKLRGELLRNRKRVSVMSVVIDYVRRDANGVVQDSARFLSQANAAGGVRIIPIAGNPVNNQPNALNDAAAVAHLDTFYPQPPWTKTVTQLPALP
jgi:hypothetical protein